MAEFDQILGLPEPVRKGTLSFEELLMKRESRRSFKPMPLSQEQLSQLLWAAYGLKARAAMKRTVPSAGGRFPLTVLICIGEGKVKDVPPGIWEYVPERHAIGRRSPSDVRMALAGGALSQQFVATSPICIALVAAYEKTTSRYGERGTRYVHIDIGHVGQNIYLQAEALGLATVAVGAFSDEMVARVLGLPPNLAPLYLMPVGYQTR